MTRDDREPLAPRADGGRAGGPDRADPGDAAGVDPGDDALDPALRAALERWQRSTKIRREAREAK